MLELRFASGEHELAAAKLAGAGGLAERVEALPDRLLVYTDDGDAAAARVQGYHLVPEAMLVRRSTLEDVFLSLTGRTLVD